MSINLDFLPQTILRMLKAFDGKIQLKLVSDLEADGTLFVEDGNHGEYRPLPHEFVDIGVPFVRPPNLVNGRIDLEKCEKINGVAFDRIRKGIGRGGDIVLTHNATIGRLAITKESDPIFVTNPQTTVWRSINKNIIDAKFLYYFMCSSGFQEQLALHKGRNATFDYVSLTKQRSLVIPVLDITIQRGIASLLASLDEKIELTSQISQTLESIAQASFKSWFVDFDPVRAKQEGRDPEGMDAETAALFSDGLEESELGVAPKGWRLLHLRDAYEINPSRKLAKGVRAPYLDMANVPTIGHSVDAVAPREMGSGTKFINEDTLLARITPCLENGKTAFVDFLASDEVGWGSTEFIVLRPKAPLPPYHAYLLCRHSQFRESAIQSMSGTSGRQRIQNDVLGHYPIAVPTQGVANAFADVIAPIQQKITSNARTAQTLSGLRDTLLPRLISGQLRLPEAEEELNEALTGT